MADPQAARLLESAMPGRSVSPSSGPLQRSLAQSIGYGEGEIGEDDAAGPVAFNVVCRSVNLSGYLGRVAPIDEGGELAQEILLIGQDGISL